MGDAHVRTMCQGYRPQQRHLVLPGRAGAAHLSDADDAQSGEERRQAPAFALLHAHSRLRDEERAEAAHRERACHLARVNAHKRPERSGRAAAVAHRGAAFDQPCRDEIMEMLGGASQVVRRIRTKCNGSREALTFSRRRSPLSLREMRKSAQQGAQRRMRCSYARRRAVEKA